MRRPGGIRRLAGWLGLAAAVALAVGWGRVRRRTAPETFNVVEVTRGPFTVWSPCEGVLEARRMERVASQVDGAAVLIELAPEALAVRPGDVLARFDASEFEADLARLEHERVRLQHEHEGLRDAELPMERLDIEGQVAEMQRALEGEEEFLEATRELAERGLLPDEEVARQAARVDGARARLHQAETRRELTLGHVHRLRLARAEAALASVETRVARARARVAQCTVRAPSGGMVVHLPLPLGGRFRTAHVGDAIHRNQAFLAVSDMRDPVVRAFIPEADLPRVAPGMPAAVRLRAFPDLRLEGRVEQVGPAAQRDDPEGRRRFPVRIAIEDPGVTLPAGLSVEVDIRTFAGEAVLQVPRRAVTWEDGRPGVRVVGNGEDAWRPIELGWGGLQTFEVRGGLAPGDRVRVP